jgi:D-alanyl-D-alanine carboxypeptidase
MNRVSIASLILIVSFSLLMIKVGGYQDGRTVDIIGFEEAAPLANIVYQTDAASPISGSDIYCLTEFNGHSVIVKYIDEDANVIEKKSSNRWPIASLTKLMTAAVALEKIGPEKTILISEKAVNTEGTTANLAVGEIYIAFDLIKATLLVSSNDAAFALAESYGTDNFVREMNQKAGELGMLQTNFFEPTGLSFLNQSTVNDLAKLVNYIYAEHQWIFSVSGQKQGIILDLKTDQTKQLLNTNQFVGRPDFLGGKTGFIDESKQNLISLFNKDNRVVLIIVLGSQDRYEETEELLKCTKPTSF